MSGHSKWATTKHKKAVVDARRAERAHVLDDITLQRQDTDDRSTSDWRTGTGTGTPGRHQPRPA